MQRAIWNGKAIAESDDTVVVEGHAYFPAGDVDHDFLLPSAAHTVCGWKGTASYYDVAVDGNVNHDAAWYYPDPKPAAQQVADRIAFWRGVRIETVAAVAGRDASPADAS